MRRHDLAVTLSTLADPPPATVTSAEFDAVKLWAENWLSKPHPDLGRAGAVCPYTASSIKKNLFMVAFVRGSDIDRCNMVGLLEKIAALFPTLPPFDGPDSMYKAVVLVFPDVAEYEQIDTVHLQCKSAFVERGLMVGQFYPGHDQPGLHDKDFRPLDAPFAMLAIRHMVAADHPFLTGNDAWLAAYDARFASAVCAPARQRAIGRSHRVEVG